VFSGQSKAAGSVEPKKYAFELDLFGEAEKVEGKETLTGKNLFTVLRKKGASSAYLDSCLVEMKRTPCVELTDDYWPRLTKDKRVHFVKTDFAKWRDQDERAYSLPFLCHTIADEGNRGGRGRR
jgi:hypothetical protein